MEVKDIDINARQKIKKEERFSYHIPDGGKINSMKSVLQGNLRHCYNQNTYLFGMRDVVPCHKVKETVSWD